jgi:hypothetical protein
MQACNFELAATGTNDGISTLFAYIPVENRPQPDYLVKLVFDHENQRLKATFKGRQEGQRGVSHVAASLCLGEIFGSITND